MKAAQLFVKALEAEGVRCIFGVPGEENLDMVEALRDDAYGMIRWKQAEMGYADYGMQLGNPDFVMFAEAHGAHGHRPASADEFLPTLQQAHAQGGVHLIDLAIDYSDNHRILDEQIRQLSAAV